MDNNSPAMDRVRSILQRMDRSIDDARRRREQSDEPDDSPPGTPPPPGDENAHDSHDEGAPTRLKARPKRMNPVNGDFSRRAI
jgi:hypothetical protein